MLNIRRLTIILVLKLKRLALVDKVYMVYLLLVILTII